MLILAPTNSALVTRDSMEDLAAKVPTSTLKVIQSNGYEIYLDATEACQKAALEFLAGLGSEYIFGDVVVHEMTWNNSVPG